ncbi:DNA polymerase III, delta subunit [Lishizhenia tianjinensis]|uniref:DNA polymerase III subunit delta n=1 Tax=Lishizhenia tianjinensis TaxID=477690 RepID=A0A1I6YJS6_9FLAO|nr:DNA polymerase III subunit delta [Lishizhenia tianjinensis]SFT50756.1 DNA polymerase III, delta subunit [Lishizhenia tianjinensis]
MSEVEIIKKVKQKDFAPVYILHGEEPYFIDLITQAIIENALDESERDFNQTILYGKDCDPVALVSQAKTYPMMAERQLVVLKEAQDMKDWDMVDAYLQNPVPTTVFVIAHKYKKVDGRKKFLKEANKKGVVFLSEKVKDWNLNAWIQDFVKQQGFSITDKALNLLANATGNDLSKITKEVDKLSIVLEKGTQISDIHIEENIGISKDYNVWELKSAVQERQVKKALEIVKYFDQNPKATAGVVVVSTLFELFKQLMYMHFSKNNTDQEIATGLKMNPFIVRKTRQATKIFPVKKTAKNIAILQEFDLKFKGINRGQATDGELYKELIYRLLH